MMTNLGDPTHWLENVDGDSERVRTACRLVVCGKTEWRKPGAALLDPDREAVHPVTCPECLRAMGSRSAREFRRMTNKLLVQLGEQYKVTRVESSVTTSSDEGEFYVRVRFKKDQDSDDVRPDSVVNQT